MKKDEDSAGLAAGENDTTVVHADQLPHVVTLNEVDRRIDGLDDATANSVTCAILGHSRLQDSWFGYWSCCRCGAQVGDSLASSYNASNVVCLDHHCDDCRRAAKTLTWKDTYRLSVAHLAYLDALEDEEGSKAKQRELAARREALLAKHRVPQP